jgi:hypothetical protein
MLEQVQFELASRHRFEEVRSSIPGRCFPEGLRRVKAEWYIVAPETSTLPKVNWLATGALPLEGQLQKHNRDLTV